MSRRTVARQRAAALLLSVLLTIPSVMLGEDLATVLAEIDVDPSLGRAVWAFDVRDADGRPIASRNPDQLMATGSVRKLFTAALVAECEDFTSSIATDFHLSGSGGKSGIWEGALVIEAHGDPSIGGRWEYETDRLRRLRPIADALARQGIRTLREGVMVDVSSFEGTLVGGAWKWDNLPYSYAAPVDAAAFNENAIAALVVPRGCGKPVVEAEPPWIAVRVETDCGLAPFEITEAGPREIVVHGSVRDLERDTVFLAQRHPATALGDAMRVALLEAGIAADGVSTWRGPQGVRRNSHDRLVARIESQPVGAMLGVVLAESSNLYAEMLFKRVSRGRGVASWAGSLAIERDFLTRRVGLDPSGFRFDDGCGLSPENLVTSRSTVELLRFMHSSTRERAVWESVLARPGDEGTLRRRLPKLRGRLFAKTGTIDGTASLAGWVYRADGTPLFFSIFVNNHAAVPREVTKAIDRIVMAIAS